MENTNPKDQNRLSATAITPSRGIFWFTCSLDSDGLCDFTDTEIIALRIPCSPDGEPFYKQNFNSKNQSNFTHERSWPSLVEKRRDLKRYPWNYFPRGRVEIRNGKPLLFANPRILECPDFKERIIRHFNLGGFQKIKVIPDNSAHYLCSIDRKTMSLPERETK